MAELDPKTQAVFKKKGYELQKKLSAGAFGQVFKAKNTKSDETVAVKVMDLDKVGEKFKEKFLPRELAALIGVKHDNACKIYDIIRANHKMFIFMEFCDSGDIAGWLQKHGAIDEVKTCFWFSQTGEALNFLHTSLHMCHRDIKVDNIMLTKDANGVLIAKLTDFGFAKESWDNDKNKPALSKTFCGTEPYYSPQIVSKKEYNPFLADAWAMGVVLFCMLNNKFPFHFGDAKKMLKEQMDKKFIENRFCKQFPDDLKDLQFKLFEPNEAKRLTIAVMLEHAWIKRKGQ